MARSWLHLKPKLRLWGKRSQRGALTRFLRVPVRRPFIKLINQLSHAHAIDQAINQNPMLSPNPSQAIDEMINQIAQPYLYVSLQSIQVFKSATINCPLYLYLFLSDNPTMNHKFSPGVLLIRNALLAEIDRLAPKPKDRIPATNSDCSFVCYINDGWGDLKSCGTVIRMVCWEVVLINLTSCLMPQFLSVRCQRSPQIPVWGWQGSHSPDESCWSCPDNGSRFALRKGKRISLEYHTSSYWSIPVLLPGWASSFA